MAVVLVVDDEVRIRDLVRRYLEHDGHQVLTAGSGAEALDIGRAHRRRSHRARPPPARHHR